METAEKLQGSVALVTGGASGLGLATVELFHKQGAKIVVFDLSLVNGAKIAKMFGPEVVFFPGDVTNEIDIKSALQVVEEKFGKLDVLVNSAGIAEPSLVYDHRKHVVHSLNEFKRIMDVNVNGTFNTVRLSTPLMISNKPDADGQRGVIVNVASMAAFEAPRGLVAYAISKAAVVGMTLPLSRELSPFGIRVVTIAPGLFATPMLAQIPTKLYKQQINAMPFPKRSGKPEEFAHLVQYIVENPMINGETIRLDGALRPML